jgi:predicted 2-oxoglutarate/Fe(II)-dependent dioxygenase YbiX
MPRHDRSTPPKELIWSVDGFYSPDECAAAIAASEAAGFEEALVTTGRGMVMSKDVRNNDRHIFDDPALASSLFDRIRHNVPEFIRERHDDPATEWQVCGVNERFRMYRYGPGHRFKPHLDGAFHRVPGQEESALTFMIYLNDDFEGGETAFQDRVVRPRCGSALFFFHAILHEGREVTRGQKYVLRSDVMYAR